MSPSFFFELDVVQGNQAPVFEDLTISIFLAYVTFTIFRDFIPRFLLFGLHIFCRLNPRIVADLCLNILTPRYVTSEMLQDGAII